MLERARYAGHQVSVMVRDPHSFGVVDQVRVLKGDATVEADVRRAVEGQQAIINVIGSRSLRHPVESSVNDVLIPAAVDAEVPRLLSLSAYGVNETARDAPWRTTVIMKSLLRRVYDDKEIADAALRASPLDWTLVYPTRLTDDPPVGDIQVVEEFVPHGPLRISRVDVARFLVDQIASRAWSRRTVIISNHH